MDKSFKVPFYAKSALIFISAYAFIYTLYIAQSIIIPIVFAGLSAILLNPLVNFFVKKHINRVVGITVAVSIAFFLMAGTTFLVSTRIDSFTEKFPELKAKFEATNTQGIRWISKTFNVRQWQIKAWTKETKSDTIDNLEIGKGLTKIGSLLVAITLIPVYLFLILYYKRLLLEFIHRLFQTAYHITINEVLGSVSSLIQRYLIGLFLELIIVAALSTAGLLILGIQYAVILGIIGAVLNIIPYIGGVISTVLAMLIAFVTKDSLTYPLLVLALYIVVQFIDNNFIVPKVVASRVQLNALVSIIVVIIGGMLWGIPGMFLSIPLTAILKVILDHIDPLKPWGYLLGNMLPNKS